MKKKHVKKLLSLLLAGAMAASLLAGCGSAGSTASSTASDTGNTTSTEAAAADAAEEADAAADAAEEGDDASESSFIADRTITAAVFVDDIYNALPDDQSATLVHQYIKEKTGIDLQITFTPGDSNRTVLATQLASGTIPDVIFCYLNNSTRPEFPILLKAAQDGMFADVSDYLADTEVFSKYLEEGYLPTDSYENIVFREDLDGVYLLHLEIPEVDRSLETDPTNEYRGGLYIQRSIAEDLGIDVKSINTQEDFYDLLVAIKEGGYTDDNGNAVYPLGPKYWGGSVDALEYIIPGYLWGVSDNYNIDDDGNVKHFAETDYVYDAIDYVRKLLDEDLMNPEFFTMDSTRAEEVSRNHNSAIIADVHNYTDIIYESDEWLPLGPLNDISGDNLDVVNGKGGYGCMAISADAENPEEILAFFDWLSSYEGQLLGEYGIEGVSYEFNEDGYPRLTAEAEAAVNSGDTDYMINNIGASFGGVGMYFYTFVQTNTNALDNFGESRPGADSENSVYARAVEIIEEYGVDKKLVPGLAASAYMSVDELADVKTQMDLLDWDETFAQACFADSDEDVVAIIESFRAQLKSAGIEQFEEYVKAIYEEDPTLVTFYK